METQLYPQKKGTPPPNSWPCLFWPNGGMDQDATWYEGKPRRGRCCVRWVRSSPLKGAQPQVFGSCLLWPNGWMDEDASCYGRRPRPRPHCIRRGPNSPRKGHSSYPSFRPMSIVATVAQSPISATAEHLLDVFMNLPLCVSLCNCITYLLPYGE